VGLLFLFFTGVENGGWGERKRRRRLGEPHAHSDWRAGGKKGEDWWGCSLSRKRKNLIRWSAEAGQSKGEETQDSIPHSQVVEEKGEKRRAA